MRWNARKNECLKVGRGVTFEQVVVAIEAGGLLDVIVHPNVTRYPEQRVLVVAIDEYVYLVPFVEDLEYLFLKTIIPSRKATRTYLTRRPGRGARTPGGREAEGELGSEPDATDTKGRCR